MVNRLCAIIQKKSLKVAMQNKHYLKLKSWQNLVFRLGFNTRPGPRLNLKMTKTRTRLFRKKLRTVLNIKISYSSNK